MCGIPTAGGVDHTAECDGVHDARSHSFQGWFPLHVCRIAVYSRDVEDAPEITVLQLPKFKAEATELIGADGIEAVAERGSYDGRRRARAKRGGARIIYLYVVIVARIYLLRCYAKNVRTDLTADEKKEVRQIVAHLKGVQ